MTALPPEASRRIAASVDAAGLRRGEREDVAAELAAHLEDGLASGRSLDELLGAFGDPSAAGVLIGRSVRRRRRAQTAPLRTAALLTLAVVAGYAGLFARLHLAKPERTFASPLAAATAWRRAPRESERAAFESVLASMYTKGDDGRLTASGLRAFQAWKGKTDPSLWSLAVEPAYFPNAARRGEVRREFERFARLAELPSRDFELERDALLSDRRRALRFVALQVPLDRMAAARAATFGRAASHAATFHRRTP
jgi:hypothetical protein